MIDFDVGLRNLDLIMGCERRVVYDLINVDPGRGQPEPGASSRTSSATTCSCLAASQTRDKDALTQDGVEKVLGPGRDGL